MQRRFGLPPHYEADVLPSNNHLTCERLVGCSIDRESETNTVLIKRVWQKLKMTDEKNRDCQCKVTDSGED